MDLNSFLYQMEVDIAQIAQRLDRQELVAQFTQFAQQRRAAVLELMWNAELHCFCDLVLPEHIDAKTLDNIQQIAPDNLQVNFEVSKPFKFSSESICQNKQTLASNYIPLSSPTIFESQSQLQSSIQSLENSGLIRNCGIVTSLCESGQQWDFPNCWPPIQSLIIDGLMTCGLSRGKDLAKCISSKWLWTNFKGYQMYGYMSEKYHCEEEGRRGGGGEYKTQLGFGWSNGVALDLLNRFGDEFLQAK
eukprot:TRINITY_DN14499_c1_g1_i1.p1 TRINITY_DN14499_c1_g1~~TRINITY_DN14499_c1_g1_i1.p1  ORF type:complete len:247 (-),score=20.35 TRINITY_DN14499_c1_g1_i1:615-1355(-)